MTVIRTHFQLEGCLQGVGFRPWVYCLAQEMGLTGWVRNTIQGVELELEGRQETIDDFESHLRNNLIRDPNRNKKSAGLPAHAQIRDLKKYTIEIKNNSKFKILPSQFRGESGKLGVDILPDLAVCRNCVSEIFNPENRRHRYPFTNCTYCGPRYSILKELPYDRENTTMDQFRMCETCLAEYSNPLDRRFHAQTNCCVDCGPFLILTDGNGKFVQERGLALEEAIDAIRAGAIVAVQGVGGFHLFCDAQNDVTVQKLRQAKRRESKPFALMVSDTDQARGLCQISSFEEMLLQGPAAPIVLLRKRDDPRIRVSTLIAPGNPNLGLILPYTPLHALLMKELESPVVATSGNVSEEPICYQEADALIRLQRIADFFLVHNRSIVSRVDDSVVREISGTEVVLRAGRGYTPWVLEKASSHPLSKNPVIGLGAHQKSTIALGLEGRIVLGPHIGNLETAEAEDAYLNTFHRLKGLIGMPSDSQVVCDHHPNYCSSFLAPFLATQQANPILRLQHHEAHLLSCVAEHRIRGEILGVAWDGTGYGLDGSIWGGEFFQGSERGFSRVGSFRQFRLPGGSIAMKETRRAALGALYEVFGEECLKEAQALEFKEYEIKLLLKCLAQKLNSPLSSSVGRLFDAVASLVGVRSFVGYEGQAAIELESAAEKDSCLETCSSTCHGSCNEPYEVQIADETLAIVDWEPWILGILKDRKQGLPIGKIAAKFHRTLAQSVVTMATRFGISQIVLSGGCFQNRLLSEWTISMLRKNGFTPFWNQRVPPNDGGISVGQVMGGWNVFVSSRTAHGSFG